MNTDRKILQIIADHLGVAPEDIDKQASLRDDLGLGPIELNDLLSELSNKLAISFDPEDIEGLQRVDDLVMLVEDNLIE